MGELKLRKYRREDFEEVLKLYLRAYRGLERYGESTRKAAKRYIRWLEKHCNGDIYVAEADGKIVGAIFIDRDWRSIWEGGVVVAIHEVFVDPDYKGRGVGHILMDVAETLAPPGTTLELWVGVENYHAIKFYESVGYAPAERWDIWIRMVKRSEKPPSPEVEEHDNRNGEHEQ